MKPCRGWNKTAWFQAGVWHNGARWNPCCSPWLHPTASVISLLELCIFCMSLWSQSHELYKGDTQTVATRRDSQCYTHRNGERSSNPACFTPPLFVHCFDILFFCPCSHPLTYVSIRSWGISTDTKALLAGDSCTPKGSSPCVFEQLVQLVFCFWDLLPSGTAWDLYDLSGLASCLYG